MPASPRFLEPPLSQGPCGSSGSEGSAVARRFVTAHRQAAKAACVESLGRKSNHTPTVPAACSSACQRRPSAPETNASPRRCAASKLGDVEGAARAISSLLELDPADEMNALGMGVTMGVFPAQAAQSASRMTM